MAESYYVVEIKYTDRPAETRKFSERVVVLGREAGDIVLHDNQSSGRHAEMNFVNGKLSVKDLGSTNGVVFNGARTPQFAVTEGQAFVCGQTTIVVREIKGPAAAFGGGRTMIGMGAPSLGGLRPPMGGAPPPGGGMRPPSGGAPPPGGGMRPPAGGAPPPGGGMRPPAGGAPPPGGGMRPPAGGAPPPGGGMRPPMDAPPSSNLAPASAPAPTPAAAPAPTPAPAPIPEPVGDEPTNQPSPAMTPVPSSPLIGGPQSAATPIGGMPMADPALAATGINPPQQMAPFAPALSPNPNPGTDVVGADFRGTGGEMLRTLFPHVLLCIPTAGIYAPWLSVRARKYEFERTVIEPTDRGPMTIGFNGTGGQLLVLMLKGILVPLTAGIYGAWYLAGLIRWSLENLVFTAGDGSRFHIKFRASGGDLIGPLILGGILTLITGGIYGAWFQVSFRKLLYSHIQFVSENGEIVGQLDFTGTGGELFWTMFKGMFLSMITAGIYFAWFGVNLRKFLWGHTRLNFASGARVATFHGTGGALFVLMLKAILIPLTLGIYLPWWTVSKIRFELNNLKFARA